MLTALFNPAGGLAYHLRALRHGTQLWAPFRRSVGSWLTAWDPPERHLIVVGPSAGYTLPLTWLRRFECLTLVEPDPLARWLFARKWRALGAETKLKWLTGRCLIHSPEQWPAFLPSGAALLYSNIVGQLRHLVGDHPERLGRVHAAIRASLPGRSWASYHDRISGGAPPSLDDSGLHLARRASDDQLRGLYQGGGPLVVLHDHATEGVFDDARPHDYFAWQLRPGYHHLVEATRSC